MAEMYINRATTNMRLTDSQALLNQQVLDMIVETVIKRVRAEMESEQKMRGLVGLRSGVFSGSKGACEG